MDGLKSVPKGFCSFDLTGIKSGSAPAEIVKVNYLKGFFAQEQKEIKDLRAWDILNNQKFSKGRSR